MKFKNIFKKETKTKAAKVQQMDKAQLAKVIGGTETGKSVTINTTHVEWCGK